MKQPTKTTTPECSSISPAASETAKVPIKTTYNADIVARLQKFADDKGLPDIQDVLRLSAAFFLEKFGY